MQAIILAGGKGRRLAPYTTVLPKPLMPIGDMPILSIVLQQLRAAGTDRVTIAIGHLGELVRAVLGDGTRAGLQVLYSMEETPLGTFGPLTLIPDLDEHFLVLNGDILTTLDYADLLAAHRASDAAVTIATKRRGVDIDFGVLETNAAGELTRYIEKPNHSYTVSMGVYGVARRALRYLETGAYCDFPNFVTRLLQEGESVRTYPFEGYWLDIGRPDDYERGIAEFEARRHEILPGAAAPAPVLDGVGGLA